MAFMKRVRDDDDVEYHGDKLISKTKRGLYRVYEDGSYYSQVSGGVTIKGKVMRDVDGKPLEFAALEEAEAWINNGCRVSLN